MEFNRALPPWATGLHIANVAISCTCLPFSLFYGVNIDFRLAILAPALCMALAYENLLLLLPYKYTVRPAQQAGWVANAMVPPLFLVVCFETGYVIHKHRSVRYFGINFDEGKRLDTTPWSWFLRNLMRLISAGILGMGLVVNFSTSFLRQSSNAGMSGYIGLMKPDKAQYYVGLVPSFVSSIMTILIGERIKRYGSHSTLRIRHSVGWSLTFWGALIQLAGQFPGRDIYTVTSMTTQTIFLVCITLTHREVYRDLLEAKRLNEFLRLQRLVQTQLEQRKGRGEKRGREEREMLTKGKEKGMSEDAGDVTVAALQERYQAFVGVIGAVHLDGLAPAHVAVDFGEGLPPRLGNGDVSKHSEDGGEMIVVNRGGEVPPGVHR